MSNPSALHERLERFVNADLPRAESRDLVRLLLGRERPAAGGEPAPAEDEYELAFGGAARCLAQAAGDLDAERSEALGLWATLAVQTSRERRVIKVRNEARFATWGLHALLLDRSRNSASQEPAAATHLAELALEVADRLDWRRYGAERIADFRAAALIALGTARRLEGDRTGAERAALEAREALEEGTGDRLEKAELLRLEAALDLDAGETEEASVKLARACSLERLLGRVAAEPTPEMADILGPLRLDHFPGQPRESDDGQAESKRGA